MTDSTHRGKIPGKWLDDDACSELEMAPELMLGDLARRAAELLVDRIQGLPEENAWDGDFRKSLEVGLLKAGELTQESSTLELLAPVSLGIVCFRINPADATVDEQALHDVNRAALALARWEDRALISSTMVESKFSLRLCIINHNTTWNDVRETLEFIKRVGREELSKLSDSA